MNIYLVITSVQILLGAVIVVSGASLLRSMPPLGGFVLGALVGMNAATMIAGPGLMTQGIGFVMGGVIGAIIAIPLQIVIVVLSSTALGVLVGAVFGFLIGQQGVSRMIVEGIFSNPGQITTLQISMMVLGGLIFGILSVRFDEGMLIASTGFLGAFAVINGLAGFSGYIGPMFRNPIFQFFGWVALGMIGAIWQNYNRD